MTLDDIVDLETYPIGDPAFRAASKETFDQTGTFMMPGFVRETAITAIRNEGHANQKGQGNEDFFDHSIFKNEISFSLRMRYWPRSRLFLVKPPNDVRSNFTTS